MKQCSQCGKEFNSLWKAKTREHGAMCKVCWRNYQSLHKSRSDGLKIGEIKTYTWEQYKQKKAISPVSDKRAEQLKEYRKLRDEWMKAHPFCEAQIPDICTGKATDLHHAAGRTGKLLTNVVYFVALCRQCHKWVEEHPEEAKQMGLSTTRLDK